MRQYSAGVGPESPASIIVPDYTAPDIFGVDFALLRDQGKTHVLTDLDLTIRRAYAPTLDMATIDHLTGLRAAGVIDSINIASNNHHSLQAFSEPLGARVFQPFEQDGATIKKPDGRFFDRILEELNISPEHAVMLGDRYQLDVVGASKAGITSVLLNPLGKDYILDRLTQVRRRDRAALQNAQAAFARSNTRGFRNLSSTEVRLADSFEAGLARAKPYLFNLAGKLINAYPEQKWDLLIGDDTGGRLVTHFVRQAMREQGIEMPVTYVCTSSAIRKSLPPSVYEAYVNKLADGPTRPRRPLLVTESVATGTSLRFIETQLTRRFATVDYAIGATRSARTIDVAGNVYIGGVGQWATQAIFRSFEEVGTGSLTERAIDAARRIAPMAIRKGLKGLTDAVGRPNSDFTNVEAPVVAGLGPEALRSFVPVAVARSGGPSSLSSYAHTRMAQLAREFTLQNTIFPRA